MLLGHREKFPAQVLDQQPGHEILGEVLLREDEENGGLLGGKALGVDCAVKAQNLLQLCVQEGVELGQGGGHDGGHGLFRAGESGAGILPGLMAGGQFCHQQLEPSHALHPRGSGQVLHQMEHGDDVPPLLRVLMGGGQVLRQQQDHSGEQALGSPVKVGVLAPVRGASLRVHDGLGQDLGVFLRLGPGRQVVRVLSCLVHVAVDEGEQVVPV